MIGKQLTAEQRLTKAVVDIMASPKYVALAGVLMVGKREIDDKVPTACTNGRDEAYGRAFVESLNDAELRFLVLHECYHKLYKHLTTWRHLYDENPVLANVACDYVINIKITDDNGDGFAKMPMRGGKAVGVLNEKYRGMDSAQVYKLLKDEHEGGGGGGSGDGSGTGIPQPGSGSGLDDHDWEGAQALTQEERKALERDLDEAIRQGALIAGKLGTGGDRDIEALLQTKVDWREALREFISTTCAGNDYSTWRRPNRRFVSMGHYLPSGVSEQVGELVIAIDTSGSIGGRELSQFLGEVKGICDSVRPDCIRLLYWDTKVCADEKYVGAEVENIVNSTKPAGGGGTSVGCVPEYMTEHAIKPQAVVVLTDGYLGGSWGTWTVPVLWCIVGGNSAVADCGKTIHVND
jgi:predicted metal-dependent peptidase